MADTKNENKKLNKLAIIRSNELRGCPFGLPIHQGCKYAGKAIERMAPVFAGESDEQKEQIARANKLIYVHYKDKKPCPYADAILEEHDKVDCDFGDTGQAQKSHNYQGSPLYPQTFSGIGLDGLYGYPLGFYADNNESRNLFFGLFSFLGSVQTKELIKLADKYDEGGESEKADVLDEIISSIEKARNEEEFAEKMQGLDEFLEEFKEKYEDERMDSGLLYELSDRWFGPRQINR